MMTSPFSLAKPQVNVPLGEPNKSKLPVRDTGARPSRNSPTHVKRAGTISRSFLIPQSNQANGSGSGVLVQNPQPDFSLNLPLKGRIVSGSALSTLKWNRAIAQATSTYRIFIPLEFEYRR